MNAPLKQDNWQMELLLAANRQLESQYRQHPSGCLALQISRNYRLLLTHQEQPQIKQHWQSLSRMWWRLYCEERDLNQADRLGWELFKPVN
jgi:hypothetical protein